MHYGEYNFLRKTSSISFYEFNGESKSHMEGSWMMFKPNPYFCTLKPFRSKKQRLYFHQFSMNWSGDWLLNSKTEIFGLFTKNWNFHQTWDFLRILTIMVNVSHLVKWRWKRYESHFWVCEVLTSTSEYFNPSERQRNLVKQRQDFGVVILRTMIHLNIKTVHCDFVYYQFQIYSY